MSCLRRRGSSNPPPSRRDAGGRAMAEETETLSAETLAEEPGEQTDRCLHCGADVEHAPAYTRYRVCPQCRFHYNLPALRRINLLTDAGTFREMNQSLVPARPALLFRPPLVPRPALSGAERHRPARSGGDRHGQHRRHSFRTRRDRLRFLGRQHRQRRRREDRPSRRGGGPAAHSLRPRRLRRHAAHPRGHALADADGEGRHYTEAPAQEAGPVYRGAGEPVVKLPVLVRGQHGRRRPGPSPGP